MYHVLVDFPEPVLRRLRIGDRVQIDSIGLGLRLLDHPAVRVSNCAPALIERWGLQSEGDRLLVPVTHLVPGGIVGSGLGRNTVWRGDFDIQLFDAPTRRRYRLGTLRFGDLVAVVHTDARFGPAYRSGAVTVGVVVHGDSTVSGHGPGVTALLTGPAAVLRPVCEPRANLAELFDLRMLPPVRTHQPLGAMQSIRSPTIQPRYYSGLPIGM